jgi:O-methyltransferase
MYFDLTKRVLTRTLTAKSIERQTLQARFPPKRLAVALARGLLRPLSLELVRLIPCTPEDYRESGDAARNRAEDAETMLGVRQLDNMQACIASVLRDGVPGDLLEAGVWRGGMTIFMRAALAAFGETSRNVWVADSFEGLPDPDRRQDSFGWRAGDMAASLDEVRDNFARYGLLDDRVRFLKGYFSSTLPSAPIERLAILRVDADLYESTLDVLKALYPKLSPGGYAIFDDYRNLVDCRRAIDEYRAQHAIVEPVEIIDKRAVFWRKVA